MVWMSGGIEKKGVKKRKISHKKTLKEGNAHEGVPEDLMFCEILPRLPIKLLFRFKSVCKLWNNIITPNNKLLAHRHHSLNSMNLCFYFERQEYVVSYNEDHAHQFKLLEPYFVNYYCNVIGSINGPLYGFCSRFRDRDIFICNPITKHDVVYVPNPNNLYHIALVVDHNNHCNAHSGFVIIAIVKIHNAVKFKVYSSKAKEWRVSNAEIQAPSLNPNNLQIPFQERVRKYNPVFKGGMVYWSFMSYIVWFDVKEEVAGLIPCPSQDNIVYHYPLTRGTYSDIGACSDSELSYIKGTQEGDIEIWLLKRKIGDCKEFEWVKRFNVSLEEIFRRNWNIMSKFCSLIKVKSLTEVAKIFADSHIIYPLPYLGGVVVWFWMYLECKERHYGKLFSFDLRNQHLKVLDGDFFLPSHPFSASFFSCPT